MGELIGESLVFQFTIHHSPVEFRAVRYRDVRLVS